jgi:hypothetical protein
MTLRTALIVFLILAAFGSVGSYPAWGHSRGWGYAPSGIGGLVVLVLVFLLLTGRL